MSSPVQTNAASNYIYVATTGLDKSNGSINTPYKTITKAANMALPGDIVIVKDGVYNEEVYINISGTSTSPITIKAENTKKAKVLASSDTGSLYTGTCLSIFRGSHTGLLFKYF